MKLSSRFFNTRVVIGVERFEKPEKAKVLPPRKHDTKHGKCSSLSVLIHWSAL